MTQNSRKQVLSALSLVTDVTELLLSGGKTTGTPKAVTAYGRRSSYGKAYRDDPRWITARQPGIDRNKQPFDRGDKVLYYPRSKTFLTGKEAEQAWREFQAAKDDEYFMSGSASPRLKVKSAKDSGSPAKDKAREASLTALVEKARHLCETVDLEGFPEVKSACDQVDKISEVATKLRELQVKLKLAPNGSEEATQHQVDLDAIRATIDSMVAPLEATLTTMETMVMAASDLEQKFQVLNEQVEAMKAKLKEDKDRLGTIAKAVETTTKMGL